MRTIAILMCVVAICVGVGYVSADAGESMKRAAVESALAAEGVAFDLYDVGCVNVIHVGDVWTDPGVVAYDVEDGPMPADKIVITFPDGPVDTSESGIFRILYDVTDTAGFPAEQLVRRIVVLPRENPPVLELLGCDEF